MKKKSYKNDILTALKEIFTKFPTQHASTHLSIAFSDYKDIDGISDKEIYFLLEKYRCEKELDMDIPHSCSIDEILKDKYDLIEDEEEF